MASLAQVRALRAVVDRRFGDSDADMSGGLWERAADGSERQLAPGPAALGRLYVPPESTDDTPPAGGTTTTDTPTEDTHHGTE